MKAMKQTLQTGWTSDRMDVASTSDRAVTEGFSEPPFTLRFRW